MSKSDNRIIKNTFFLYIRMFFVLIVSLYTSRVVLNTLGVSDYGVYNVVAGFVTLFAFLNATLTSSMQRFFNYEKGLNGDSGFNEVYSTGFRIHVILAAVILVILETFGIWYVNGVMVLPECRLFAANIVFQVSVLSMVLVIIEIPYLSAIMAQEKMNYYALVSIIDVVLKLAIVLVLPFLPSDKLITYASLVLIITITNFLMYFLYAKKKFQLHIEHSIDKDLFKQLMSFSGWNLVGTFAFMLKGQGVNMVLNYFCGTLINAARGVAFQVNSGLVGFSSSIATAYRPQVVESYAKKEYNRFLRLSFSQAKVCYALLYILSVPLIMEIDFVLKIWLGKTIPDSANIFTILVLLDAVICTLITPFTQMVFSTGNIKTYQIVTSIINLLLVPFCWLALKLGYSATSVFVITIVFSVANLIANVFLVKRVFYFSVPQYLTNVIVPCLMLTALLPVIPFLLKTSMESSWLRLILIILADLVSALVISLFYFNKEEKARLLDLIKRRKANN